MTLLVRLVLLLLGLGLAGGFFAYGFAELFTTAREIMIPFVLVSAAILAAALGYLVSTFRRR